MSSLYAFSSFLRLFIRMRFCQRISGVTCTFCPLSFFFFFTPSSLRVMLQMQSRGARDSFLQGARRGAQVLQRSQSSLHCLDAGGDASTTEQLLIGAFQFRQKRAPFHSLGDAVCGASFAPFTWSHDGAFSSDFIFTPPCSRAGSILHLVH